MSTNFKKSTISGKIVGFLKFVGEIQLQEYLIYKSNNNSYHDGANVFFEKYSHLNAVENSNIKILAEQVQRGNPWLQHHFVDICHHHNKSEYFWYRVILHYECRFY